ncbi:hypothetical protein QTP86_010175 [Hemibagrus guttatus]|nr:hypothetical protein QTP86_010175 [Hemibagrus guttatus]
MDRTEENRQEYKELQRRVKREVSKAKQKAYDELYTRLDTREGEKDLYRLARQRDRDGKDVQQVRVIKDRDGSVLTSEESVQRRWKEYFEELMNEENEREKRVEGVNSVEQKVDKVRKDEVRKALKRMKSGKAVGPDDIPVEVWKCLGEAAVEFLTSLFNRVLESERMPEEWRRSVLVPIFKNKGDVQSCSNYRGIKLMSHTMKVWERVVEARLRKVVEICEQQYGFMPRKSTTDAIFALRILMEKYRDGQRELHCVFVDLEKAYDRVPRKELWYCMRKSGVAEKYVRVVQDMYERSRTVVRCAVGQTEEFKVEVGLHQGSALSPFLFVIVMDQLSEEVRQESPWTLMFADDIVICSESREQVEENLERWRSRGQQSKQGCPDFPLPRHFLQLFWRDPEAFPGQPRDIVSKACPRSSPGSLPGGACPEHLPRETSRRHPKQMPEPPQLSPLDVEEQRLYSELLLGDRAPYPISKEAAFTWDLILLVMTQSS